MYRTFTRNWYVEEGGKLIPKMGKKTYTGNVWDTEAEARKECTEYNRSNKPGRLSNKMEFEGC